ncbi:MAG TPA: GNAT family N-acetyltransferase [Ilumatobacteraceae bacterium]|nr:GNAT family N-acetyltransferase [Ilumatobacteraceae bacterium]HRB02395.1 GNAT family N-acetyltransferase [Ilumatobacteraceae bacterium]
MTASLDEIDWPVRTRRLVIRPAVDDDEAAVWSYRKLATTSTWLNTSHGDRASFRKSFRDPVARANTLVIEHGDSVIGDLLVRIEDGVSQTEMRDKAARTQAEIGWALHPDHAGRGYATEAVNDILRVCFDELGLRRVIAGCFSANTESWRLMERVGMRRERHTIRHALHRSGEWMDGYGYALLAEEWRVRLDQPVTQ